MKIVCISDTHNRTPLPEIAPCDVVVHAGDLTMTGTLDEVDQALTWGASLPCERFIFTPGNHDWLFQRDPYVVKALLQQYNGKVVCLLDESYLYNGLTFYGSPWQPYFQNWAFNLQPGGLERIWKKVPAGMDVLVTHTPPMGLMDRGPRGTLEGCEFLRRELPRIAPRLHVFGHIHEGYGVCTLGEVDYCPGTVFVNASICNGKYRTINAPVEVEP